MKTLLDKTLRFWRRKQTPIMAIAFIVFAIILILLEYIFKRGILCVNIAEYLAMSIAFAILFFMTIDYARKIYSIVKQEKK
jgi:hypothetical protein